VDIAMEQQQEGSTSINRGILESVRRLLLRALDGDAREQQQEREQQQQQQHRCDLRLDFTDERVNRQSVQYLVDFLSGEDAHEVTELVFGGFLLVQHPSDGGLHVLCNFLANNTTMTKVTLSWNCDFGTAEEASQLLAALQTNRSVTDLTIYKIDNLQGAELGRALSGLLQNNETVQRLSLGSPLTVACARTIQPGLRSNRNLKELNLSGCHFDDECLGLIVDALIGNTSMDVLDISANYDITWNVLVDDITRLVESTRLKKVGVHNTDLFKDEHAVQRFTDVLRRHSSLEEMPGLDLDEFPVVRNLLARNVRLRRANALLAIQPRTNMPIASKSGIWYMAMEKLSIPIPDGSSGSSAIFHILRTRLGILEKQLLRPAAAVDAAAGQKRQRL
jgi:hypothetical protein